MRKYILFIILACSTTLAAQTRLDKPEIYFGGSFGVTESTMGFKPTVEMGFVQGFNGGATFRYIAEKNVGVQAELNFSQRGWKESSGLYTRQLNYIELPFLTHIFIGKTSRVFINLGPKISYLISEKVLTNKTVASTEGQHTTAIQHPFDYGMCVGLGFMTNIHGQIFQVESRGYYGLSDVYSNLKKDYFDASNNMNLSLNVSWLIKTK